MQLFQLLSQTHVRRAVVIAVDYKQAIEMINDYDPEGFWGNLWARDFGRIYNANRCILAVERRPENPGAESIFPTPAMIKAVSELPGEF